MVDSRIMAGGIDLWMPFEYMNAYIEARRLRILSAKRQRVNFCIMEARPIAVHLDESVCVLDLIVFRYVSHTLARRREGTSRSRWLANASANLRASPTSCERSELP